MYQQTCETADSPMTVRISSICSKTFSGTTFATEEINENIRLRVTPSFAEWAHSTNNLMLISFKMSSCHENEPHVIRINRN